MIEWAIRAGVGIAGALVATIVVRGYYVAEIKTKEAAWAAQVADAEREQRKAEQAARDTESKWRAKHDQAQKDLKDASLQISALRASVRPAPFVAPVDAGLRGRLETARLAGQAAADAAASCNARAGAYETAIADNDRAIERMGRSLVECRTDAIGNAEAHDLRSAEVRALLAAWPK